MDSTLIWVHIIVAITVILPAVLMQFVNLDKPNHFLGYRTPASMKSKESWKFANRLAAKLVLWGTGITLTVQIFTVFALSNTASILITCGFLTVSYISILALVESQLVKRFDKEGKPKLGYSRFD